MQNYNSHNLLAVRVCAVITKLLPHQIYSSFKMYKIEMDFFVYVYVQG